MSTKELHRYTIAGGITNKVGADRFFLVIDYDRVESADLYNEIQELQMSCSLSDATIYRTNSGYHVFFFNDNKLSADEIKRILAMSRLADPDFVGMFNEISAKGGGVTIRLAGKYSRNDIALSRTMRGYRKPSLLEISLGQSLLELVQSGIEEPLINHSDFPIVVDSTGGPGKEIKVPAKSTTPDLKDSTEGDTVPKDIQDVQAVFSASTKSKEEVEVNDVNKVDNGARKEASLEEVFPENKKITALRKKWYRGGMSNSIARLISASTENRELALNKLPTCMWVKEEDFVEYRPFFLNNSRVKNDMLKPYEYILKATRLDELPFNFFQSHATYDVAEFDHISLKDFKKQKEFKEYLKENSRSLITGMDIIFDIDCKDPEKNDSYEDARKLRDLLKTMNIPFSLNFSGSKGFHIRIPSKKILQEVPEFLKYIQSNASNLGEFFNRLSDFTLSHGITVDKKAYSGDVRCQIRVLWSVHPATGSVVKPLTDAEFDALNGKKLREIQEMYRVDNLISGNSRLGVSKLNLQRRSEFLIRMIPSGYGEYLSWEEMRDSGKFDTVTDGKTEWEHYRSEFINPLVKELRKIADNDPKTFNDILEAGEYDGYLVEAPEYIDLVTGRNHDYCRKGREGAIKDFLLKVSPEIFSK